MPAFFNTASGPLALSEKKTRNCGHDEPAHAVTCEYLYSEKINLVPLTKEFLERGQEVSQLLAIQTAGLSLIVG
jgi:hypothetical protein